MDNAKTSELRLEWKRRESGGGRTQRDYLDFVIDNESLSEKAGGDLVSCLGWFLPVENAKAVGRLLLEEPADLSGNRRSLYVCPECGALDCGAITVTIERVGDKIIWRDFAYVGAYDEGVRIEQLKGMRNYIFNREEYEGAIRGAL